MKILNLGRDLYIKGRIGWRGLSKDEYLPISDYKIINATALMDGYVDWNNCGYISQERYEESDEIMLQENDILISKDGTLGKIGYVKGITTACTVASGVFILRNIIPECLDFDYLFHVLKSSIFKDFIRRNKANGSTINHLYQRDLENFELELPSMENQKFIAETLNFIDNKIINNNAINEKLEEMVKTIYHYWFLQFDFPNEKGDPYKSAGGKLIWNEDLKKDIPEGWCVKDILDLCEIVDCLHSKKPDYKYDKEECYLLTLENITEKGYIDVSSKYYISEEDYKEWTKKITVSENDFVITNAGRAGDIGRIHRGITCAIGRNMTAIRPIKISPYYLRQFFKSNYVAEQIMSNLDCGSFFMSFNVKSIKKLKIIISDENTMKAFLKCVEPIVKEIDSNNIENQELVSLREFLLPLLMNGQVGF